MMNVSVEQAVFTSARTSRLEGYQLVSTSSGISEQDARELTVWGPAHDSLLRDDLSASSVNFHALSSEKYCISRTIAGQSEYSGRSGRQVFTHCLVVDKPGFLKFANNPFRVLSAATSTGELRLKETYPTRLQPLKLFPVGKAVDFKLFEQSRSDGLPYLFTSWFDTALNQPRLALTGYKSEESMLMQFFNLLPVEVRPEFSFSTGLKYSQRRPFRILGLQGNVEEQKRAVRQEAIRLLDLSNPAMEGDLHRHGWANWVLVALRSNLPASAINLLSQERPDLTLSQLSELGRKLQVKLTSMEEEEAALAEQLLEDEIEQEEISNSLATETSTASISSAKPNVRKRGHAAHVKFTGTKQAALQQGLEIESPATQMPGLETGQREQLQQLDRLVIEALSGRIDSLAQLQVLWPEIRAGFEHSDQLKAQEYYLTYAMAAWEQINQGKQVRSNKVTSSALDVLTLIFDQV